MLVVKIVNYNNIGIKEVERLKYWLLDLFEVLKYDFLV